MRNFVILAAMAMSFFPLIGHAQSLKQMAQAAINADGKDCPQVTVAKAIGTDESGTAYVAAACSNGSKHVLKIVGNPPAFDYVSTCSVFMAMGAKRCL